MMGFAFGEPPKEAADYFAAKKLGNLYSFDYRDVWKGEHVTNFVVAKAVELDVLTTLHDAVQQAITKGIPFSDFKKNLQPELERLGWWGRQSVTDQKTGIQIEAQLGSPERLRIIYDTNISQAYNAGKWVRAEKTKRAMPYLVYRLGASLEHREEHVQWDGVCLPIDDPWWDVHMPQNGWGCKCWVQQITKAQFEQYQQDGIPSSVAQQEINPETGLPTGRVTRDKIPLITAAPKTETYEWYNARTQQTLRVPKGIDPGFDYNPGKDRFNQLMQVLDNKVQVAPPPLRQPFLLNFIDTYTNLYIAAADLAIATQNAVAKRWIAYWISVYELLKK